MTPTRLVAKALLAATLAIATGCGSDFNSNIWANPEPGSPSEDSGEGDTPWGAPPGEGDIVPHECRLEPTASPFENPSLELHWSPEAEEPFASYAQVIHAPVVIDFVQDGPDDMIPEILFVSYRSFNEPGVLRVISGRAPHELLMTIPGRPGGDGPELHFDGHPAAGDLDGDGRPEIVVSTYPENPSSESAEVSLLAFRGDGSLHWESDPLAWSEVARNAALSIADLEGDGSPEIVVGRCVFDSDGSLLWCGDGGQGKNGQGPLSCVADLDGDGRQEVIAGRTAYRHLGDTFEVLWERNDEGDGFCAIADLFDGGAPGRDGRPEVVRVSDGTLYVHSGPDGRILWSATIPSSGGRGGAPTVADFDGDGLAEIGVAGARRYSVFDVDRDEILWEAETEDDSSRATASTVFDFNGDGTAEVIYNDEQRFMVLSGPDGRLLFEQWNPSRTRTEEPVVADVDNDGNAEIIFCGNTEADFAGDGIPSAVRGEERIPGLEIWASGDDSWVPALPIWNQHTFHVTNVDVRGRVPAGEPASWLEHNTYRLNSAGELTLAAPNLTGLEGSLSCTGMTMTVCVDVANLGELRVGPGISVAFATSTGEAVCSGSTEGSLSPGEVEAVCCEWVDPATEPTEVVATIDARGENRECHEDDNEVSLGASSCVPLR